MEHQGKECDPPHLKEGQGARGVVAKTDQGQDQELIDHHRLGQVDRPR